MHEEIRKKLVGTVATIFTPFDKNYDIDFKSLERHIVSQFEGGAEVFYAMAYNSRYGLLSREEILELNAFCAKTVKELSIDNILIVGDPITGSLHQKMEYAIAAKENGADLFSALVQEKFFSIEQVLEHYKNLGAGVDIPILVHEMPFTSGFDGKQMDWPNELIKRLSEIPQVVAIKEDSKNVSLTKLALELEPDIRVVLAGTKKNLMQFRSLGIRSYLNGISIIDAKIGKVFWDSFQNGVDEVTQQIIDKVESPFFEGVVARFGWHRTNKALLQAAGFMHRRERLPMVSISDQEYEQVEEAYSNILSNWKSLEKSIS